MRYGYLFLMAIGFILVGWWMMVQSNDRGDTGTIILSRQEQEWLLLNSRRQLEAKLTSGAGIEVNQEDLSHNLKQEAACFVTLNKDGALRGCIVDSLHAHEPIYQNVLRNVVLAATADPRFSPVTPDELDRITIEISILSRPKRLEYSDSQGLLRKITPGKDGVILTTTHGTSTYLPQVWEFFSDPAEFLSRLCEKQGAAPDCWQETPPPRIETYRAFHFSEEERGLRSD